MDWAMRDEHCDRIDPYFVYSPPLSPALKQKSSPSPLTLA